jgi:hypothetical protein
MSLVSAKATAASAMPRYLRAQTTSIEDAAGLIRLTSDAGASLILMLK